MSNVLLNSGLRYPNDSNVYSFFAGTTERPQLWPTRIITALQDPTKNKYELTVATLPENMSAFVCRILARRPADSCGLHQPSGLRNLARELGARLLSGKREETLDGGQHFADKTLKLPGSTLFETVQYTAPSETSSCPDSIIKRPAGTLLDETKNPAAAVRDNGDTLYLNPSRFLSNELVEAGSSYYGSDTIQAIFGHVTTVHGALQEYEGHPSGTEQANAIVAGCLGVAATFAAASQQVL